MDNPIQRLNNQGQIRNPEGKLIHYMYGRVENRKWQPLQMHKRFIRYFQNYMQESPKGIVLELSKLGLLSVNIIIVTHSTRRLCLVGVMSSIYFFTMFCKEGFKHYQADLATEHEHQLTKACADETTGLTNGRAANWALEVMFSPFRALSPCQLTFPSCC